MAKNLSRDEFADRWRKHYLALGAKPAEAEHLAMEATAPLPAEVKPLSETLLDEWYLWNHGRRPPPSLLDTIAAFVPGEALALRRRAESEADDPPEEEAPAWGITEDNFAPYIPLEIGDRHTAFEWMMLAADLDPNAPWVGIQGDAMSDAEARETRMLTLVPELWLNLKQDIEGMR